MVNGPSCTTVQWFVCTYSSPQTLIHLQMLLADLLDKNAQASRFSPVFMLMETRGRLSPHPRPLLVQTVQHKDPLILSSVGGNALSDLVDNH